MQPLTKEILEEPRTAKTYLPWTTSLMTHVKTTDPNGLRDIRLGHGLVGRHLYREAFPIGVFASRYFNDSDKVFVQLVVGNQNYDALVQDNRPVPSGITHVEVTIADEGEQDYLRMKHLHENGISSGLRPIKKSGTRNTGLSIEMEDNKLSREDVLGREGDNLRNAIARKLSPTKHYPTGTVLLVGFKDERDPDDPESLSNLEQIVDSFISQLARFHSIAVIGTTSKRLFIYRRTGAESTDPA